MRPTRLVVESYMFRGARLWLLTRATIAGVFLLAGSDPLRLPTRVTVAFVLLTVVICFIDTYRHHERALLGNLGVGSLLLAAMFASPAVIGESLLRLIGALV